MRFASPLLVACSLSAAVASAAEPALTAAPAAGAARASSPREPGLLVRRGAWAVLSTTQGGVAVESRVEVLQDGRAGQRVLVRGSSWPQPIAARVMGDGILEPAR